MKWFKLFAFKRKSVVFRPFDGFFELHSRATEGKKVKKGNFLANGKSLNHFNIKINPKHFNVFVISQILTNIQFYIKIPTKKIDSLAKEINRVSLCGDVGNGSAMASSAEKKQFLFG